MATMGFLQADETQKQTTSIIVPETFTHSIAFGETGCGKTSSYIYPNLLHRIRLGHGILLYDYKGKEHLSVKALAHKAGRLADVVEIGKPWGESINLIQKMDEDELDRFFDNILNHGKDSIYWQNSAKSLGQTLLNILKGIEDFALALECIDGIKREYINAGGMMADFKYPTRRTLSSLIGVCKTFELLKTFVSESKHLVSEADKLIKKAAKYALADAKVDSVLQAKFTNLIAKKEALQIAIETNKNALESFGEDSNENLTQNIMGSLVSPLISLSQNESFNTNSFDIVAALNQGKIIIINVESLSNAAMESLNNSILYELSKRTKSINIHPVSIFIDEVQRVVSEKTDLPVDVFREAKVDMFLATQNSSLLKEKLKEEKFDALMGNLTQKFYYRSSSDEELETELSLKELDGFEYLASRDDFLEVHKAKPIFLDRDKLMLVEFSYQKSKSILENFLYKYRNARVIVEYDSRLYKENKIIAIDLKTKKEHIVDSLTKENIEYLELEALKLFKTTLEEIRDTHYLGKDAA